MLAPEEEVPSRVIKPARVSAENKVTPTSNAGKNKSLEIRIVEYSLPISFKKAKRQRTSWEARRPTIHAKRTDLGSVVMKKSRRDQLVSRNFVFLDPGEEIRE